jgi:glyoxylate reductase/D-3-phosphoglycerate dehydrogenase
MAPRFQPLRVALAQIDPTVGDIAGNAAKIADRIGRAKEAGAAIVVFPELALTGYPPEDLLLKEHFLADAKAALERVASDTRGLVAVIGFPERAEDVSNAAAVCADGVVQAVYRKIHLPNYGVFDEVRYFQSGPGPAVIEVDGVKVGLTICEDVWQPGPPLSDEALAGARRLKLVQLMSVGYDTFNLAAARAARVPVAVNGGANAIAVAEHAVMLMLAALKHLSELDPLVRAGQWRSGPSGEQRLYEIWHSTVGIVGMGRIGQEVARRLRGWEATLLYYDPVRLPAEREQSLGVTYAPLDDVLRQADAVTVHVPLSDRTRHLIDARALGLMKSNAVLVNTSRGGLVDELALASALQRGRIAGAGLDVFSQEPPPADHPLLRLPNVVLTPHVAGPTWQSWPRRFANCFANIARVERGEPPQWVVPELADLGAGA